MSNTTNTTRRDDAIDNLITACDRLLNGPPDPADEDIERVAAAIDEIRQAA